jgi:sugar lactone lactonase YvrE
MKLSMTNDTASLIAQPVLQSQALLGEGALWSYRDEKLYWIDIEACAFHIYDPVANTDKIFSTVAKVGTVVPLDAGNVLLALQNGIHEMDIKTGECTLITNPISDPNIRFNDGKCDSAGRLWVGTVDRYEKKGASVLYRIDKDKTTQVMLTNVTISNGIVWSLDNRTMYYIDTPTRCVQAFDYDNRSGNISNGKIAIRINNQSGYPDGMTIDAEGKLWIALWGGGCVSRYDPNSGECICTIKVPAPNTTSCAFGGKDLKTLYITTARQSLHKDELKQYPLSGNLFSAVPGVSGVKSNIFGIDN